MDANHERIGHRVCLRLFRRGRAKYNGGDPVPISIGTPSRSIRPFAPSAEPFIGFVAGYRASIMLTVIDLGTNNLKSVTSALRKCRIECEVTNDPEDIAQAHAFVVPWAGPLGPGLDALDSLGLRDELVRRIQDGAPTLGLGAGAGLLTNSVDNHATPGLGVLRGKTIAMPALHGLSVPQVGWNDVRVLRPDPLLDGIASGSFFYFHNWIVVEPDSPRAPIATSYYSVEFAACLRQTTVFAVLFEADKSSELGLRILENFDRVATKILQGDPVDPIDPTPEVDKKTKTLHMAAYDDTHANGSAAADSAATDAAPSKTPTPSPANPDAEPH